MLKNLLPVYFFILFGCLNNTAENSVKPVEYALVIHGGAGTITKENMTPNAEAEYRNLLQYVLKNGKEYLSNGMDAVDVVERLTKIMEDSPLFNAGKGSVFNAEGKQDMDASIMEGATLNCGAITGVSNIKNPISAARLVMDSSKHVMLAREGAEIFAEEMGLQVVDSDYFFNQRRYDYWKSLKDKELSELSNEQKHSTVGVVCLDRKGNLAAGTSTGGMTFKKWGRVGDSPIIGAGTYADNKSCAVSCTGHGEYFIRATVARDISALMEFKGYTLKQATEEIIHEKLIKMGGTGGVIAVDRFGNYAMTFNTEGMYRAAVTSNTDPEVLIYK